MPNGPGWELHHERRGCRQHVVLPPDGASGIAGEARLAHPRQAREPALDRGVSARLVHHRQRLVEPHRYARSHPQDEPLGDPGLRRVQRPRAGVLAAGVGKRAPAPREVAVQVDSLGVLPRVRGDAVRVQVVDHPDAGRRWMGLQRAGHADPGGLVAVDAADHEQ